MAERPRLFRQTVNHMPEVDMQGPRFTFFWPDAGTIHHFITADVTTQTIIP